MKDPTKPVPGEAHIDATDVVLTDITPEQIQKLTKVRDGFETSVAEVINLKTADVERAGLNPAEIARLSKVFAEDQRIGELLPAAEKLAELLREARQLRRHDIGTILAEQAAQGRRRSERVANGAEVLGPLAALMEYQYGPGAKAAATKEKTKASIAITPGTATAGSSTSVGSTSSSSTPSPERRAAARHSHHAVAGTTEWQARSRHHEPWWFQQRERAARQRQWHLRCQGRLHHGSDPLGMAAADLNHDSRPDLVVPNRDSNTVSVLLNACLP